MFGLASPDGSGPKVGPRLNPIQISRILGSQSVRQDLQLLAVVFREPQILCLVPSKSTVLKV